MFANLHGLRIVAVRKAFQNKYTILVSRCEIILVLIGSSTRVLKFHSSGLLEINGVKTKGVIITGRVSERFTETLIKRDSVIPH